jgi:hypothetical protein
MNTYEDEAEEPMDSAEHYEAWKRTRKFDPTDWARPDEIEHDPIDQRSDNARKVAAAFRAHLDGRDMQKAMEEVDQDIVTEWDAASTQTFDNFWNTSDKFFRHGNLPSKREDVVVKYGKANSNDVNYTTIHDKDVLRQEIEELRPFVPKIEGVTPKPKSDPEPTKPSHARELDPAIVQTWCSQQSERQRTCDLLQDLASSNAVDQNTMEEVRSLLSSLASTLSPKQTSPAELNRKFHSDRERARGLLEALAEGATLDETEVKEYESILTSLTHTLQNA